MRKNVWILNHYATNMIEDLGGRHYWIAEQLINNGYNPTILCASTLHGREEKSIQFDGDYQLIKANEIPFVLIKSTIYHNNGIKRILNMLSFYFNIIKVSRKPELLESIGRPDVIVASSVHPLTLVAGIKIAEHFNVPCVTEVRDLWPESLVAYGVIKKESFLTRCLYAGEKWIYKRADAIIMTWEGGKQYLLDQGWEEDIDMNKVYHISNGLNLKKFDEQAETDLFSDHDLDNSAMKNIIYAGSIRRVNNLSVLLDAAKIIQNVNSELQFLIFGDGDELDKLKKKCKEDHIRNVIFKGRVEKKYIPSILKKADLNILHNSSTNLNKYGQSQNKFFEYLASGRGIIQTYTTGFSILETQNCGVMAENQTPEEISDIILKVCTDEENLIQMGINARRAAQKYDFKSLTRKLIEILETFPDNE